MENDKFYFSFIKNEVLCGCSGFKVIKTKNNGFKFECACSEEDREKCNPIKAIETIERFVEEKNVNNEEKDSFDVLNGFCPNCGNLVEETYHESYCGFCGQKLKW